MLRDIVTKYGNNYGYTVSGHSLGGTEVMNVFLEDEYLLNKITRVNLFTPGLTPTHALQNAKAALKDDRVHLYLNSGDLLSNAMVSLVHEDNHVVWGKPTHSFSHNHGLTQWSEEV
jgi:hypothetical protein